MVREFSRVNHPNKEYVMLSNSTSSNDLIPVTWLNQRINFIFFWAIHCAALVGVWFTGVTMHTALVGFVEYWVLMFVITGGYHRYFSHRAYKTSRAFQFLLGLLGTLCVEKGPIWWASTHRRHHKFTDVDGDPHSPKLRGFWYAHIGWLSQDVNGATYTRYVKDWLEYPELVWLGKYHWVAPTLWSLIAYALGGWQGVVVCFAWPVVLNWHGNFCINSLDHMWGSRRYDTPDTSRNNWLLSIFMMGEGWHNNHHYYQSCARQGFYWWELDFTYYILRLLALTGIIWDIKEPPAKVYVHPR